MEGGGARSVLGLRGVLRALDAPQVVLHAVGEQAREITLPLAALEELVLLAVRDEGGFHEDGGDAGGLEDDEARLFDAAVVDRTEAEEFFQALLGEHLALHQDIGLHHVEEDLIDSGGFGFEAHARVGLVLELRDFLGRFVARALQRQEVDLGPPRGTFLAG